MKTIDIGKDFHPNPGGRTPKDGVGNGTSFRENFLLPILRNGEKATIILDNATGYPASFLDEAFGGLVLKEEFEPEDVLKAFNFQSDKKGFSGFEWSIRKYINAAGREKSKSSGS